MCLKKYFKEEIRSKLFKISIVKAEKKITPGIIPD
jgi:hypothetical protein